MYKNKKGPIIITIRMVAEMVTGMIMIKSLESKNVSMCIFDNINKIFLPDLVDTSGSVGGAK